MNQEQIDYELSLKNYIKISDTRYEQHIKSFIPYYLNFHNNEWRLKQLGNGMNIMSCKELNKESLILIFKLTSNYAKELNSNDIFID